MTIPDRYEAFWIPGPDELDRDEGLHLGYRWLETAPYRGERVVVLYAKKMVNNRRTLAEASRYHVVSPRARDIPYTSAGPVLAIWPNADTLELAQELALDSALCVIPYRHDITWWITRTGAVNLTEPESQPVTRHPLIRRSSPRSTRSWPSAATTASSAEARRRRPFVSCAPCSLAAIGPLLPTSRTTPARAGRRTSRARAGCAPSTRRSLPASTCVTIADARSEGARR